MFVESSTWSVWASTGRFGVGTVVVGSSRCRSSPAPSAKSSSAPRDQERLFGALHLVAKE